MRIVFFIGALTTGGAERQIALLADGLAQRGHNVIVATLYPGGQNWNWLQDRGFAKVESLYKKKYSSKLVTACQLIWSAFRLRSLLNREKVTVVYSALNLPNLIAWLAVSSMRSVNLIWGSRSSSTTKNWKDALSFHVCSYISFSVPLLIANSRAGLYFFETNGYRAKKHIIISNGIDTSRFKYDSEGRSSLRDEWNISQQEKLIGLVGRLDPMKDHKNFLHAAEIISKNRSDIRFVCVGDGKEKYRTELHLLSDELGLSNSVIWAGDRYDICNIYSALDIATSSSAYGEGFPNCVGEAMACSVSCVVTNVGDSAQIVEDNAIVIEPKNPGQLAGAWLQLVMLDVYQRKAIGDAARARIESNYSVESAVTATEEAMLRLFN